MDYLPRLAPEFYQGDAVVHWTLTVFDRGRGWLNELFHQQFRELLLHASAREGLVCPCYCLMPDHVHLVWMGLRVDSDQRNGMSFVRTYAERLLGGERFQPQAHDHVLRAEERHRNGFARHCGYILQNPVRAKLKTTAHEWPYAGAIVPGYPTLSPHEENFWPLFWKLYQRCRDPEAGNRSLPRRSSS